MVFLTVLELHSYMHVKHSYCSFEYAVTSMCHIVSHYSVFK